MLLKISKIISHVGNVKLKLLHKPLKNQAIFGSPGTSQFITAVHYSVLSYHFCTVIGSPGA